MINKQTEEQRDASCDVSSHVNYCYLDTPQKLKKMKNMHSTITKQKVQVKSLQDKLAHHLHSRGVQVEEELQTDFTKLIELYTKNVTDGNDAESFQSMFWK